MGEKLTRLVERQENGSSKSLASFIPPALLFFVSKFVILLEDIEDDNDLL